MYAYLVQLPKFKIILVAACFFVVEGVDAHVDFLEFLGAVVECGGSMLLSGSVTTMSGVSTVPLGRLMCFDLNGITLLIINSLYYSN